MLLQMMSRMSTMLGVIRLCSSFPPVGNLRSTMGIGERRISKKKREILSNGEYKNAVHRALVNSSRARLSVATFYDPSKTRKISPAPKLITENSPQKYREVLYGDYVSSWYGKGPEGKRNLDALRMVQG